MKFVTVAGVLLLLSGASAAETKASLIQAKSRAIVVAQSYCAMCADSNTSCRLTCNGSGTCIQACDDQLRECRRQNCESRNR